MKIMKTTSFYVLFLLLVTSIVNGQSLKV